MKNPNINIAIKKKLIFMLFTIMFALVGLTGRVFYIQYFQAEFLQSMAYAQQTRDRLIKPNRGAIYDRNMVGIALTETVASVSVIHRQIQEPERVAEVLSQMLDLDYDYVYEKVGRRVALERIKTRVDRDIAAQIAQMNLAGVVIDEDIRRIYPFSTLASHVLGFVGRDNQGIVGLEAKFESFLGGESGRILTETDVIGREVPDGQRIRIPPVDGYSLVTTIDTVVQLYAEQILDKAVEFKGARRGAIIVMNPQTGELYAMANKPDFDLNDPFTINDETLKLEWNTFSPEDQNKLLNQMWRNFSINDTYEPGSTFKIITSTAGFEEGVITPESVFVCSGAHMVGDRMIRCWRYPRSHGALTFKEGVQNSCNPVFMIIAEQLGAERFFEYLHKFGLHEKTGVDIPGEAVAIMHSLDNVGSVELATMSFGQSFQITPLQLMRSTAATVNGGYLVTPHFVKKAIDNDGNIVEVFENPRSEQIISSETSELMAGILEEVVYLGTGHRTYVPGFRIGGKTATSEKLPRGNRKYISSFLTFAPADNPTVMALMLIDEPQGVYYGGAVVGPFMRELLMNILPYLGVEPLYYPEEMELPWVRDAEIPDLTGMTVNEASNIIRDAGLRPEVMGDGKNVREQFPRPGSAVNAGSRVKIYTDF